MSFQKYRDIILFILVIAQHYLDSVPLHNKI